MEENHTECKLQLGFEGEILGSICHSCLAIGGSVGNVLLILVIIRTPSIKTVCGLLISNVAVADLLVTSVVMPIIVFALIQGFFPQLCLFIPVMTFAVMAALFSATASILTLTTLSIDRCFAICNPLKHKIWVTFTKVKILIAIVWIISLVLPITETINPGVLRASSILQTVGVGLCYVAIIISGIFTIRKVCKSSLHMSALHNNQGRNNMNADLYQRNKQVAKTVAWVILLFSLCWLPISVVVSIDYSRSNDRKLYFWCGTLGLANSVVTPWVYFYRQANYRQALKKLMGWVQDK